MYHGYNHLTLVFPSDLTTVYFLSAVWQCLHYYANLVSMWSEMLKTVHYSVQTGKMSHIKLIRGNMKPY